MLCLSHYAGCCSAECHRLVHCAGCYYAECHDAGCYYAGCHYVGYQSFILCVIILNVIYAECHRYVHNAESQLS